MSVLIGDLMAVADERYESGGEKKSRKRGAFEKSAKGTGGADDQRDPSAGKNRGLQDDRAFIEEPTRAASLRTEGRLPPKLMGELSELDFCGRRWGWG